MPVPLLDLPAQLAPLQAELRAAFDRVLSSGRFVLGPEVEAFEEKLALRLDVPHAVGVSSGSDALVAALRALGVGVGDEVVTTPYTFVASAEAILRVGATPRFVDVEPGSLCLDPALLESALCERTRAILPVHLFGRRADVAALGAAGEARGIPIVEDSA